MTQSTASVHRFPLPRDIHPMAPSGDLPLQIAIVSICYDVMDEVGIRTLALISGILRSEQSFAGLRQVLPDGVGLAETVEAWVRREKVDLILVVDETTQPLPATARADTLAVLLPGASPGTALADIPALGLVGVFDVRAQHQQLSA